MENIIDFGAKTTNTNNIEVCECGNRIWTQGIVLKKISSLISQSGTPEVMPIPVFLCSKCGELAPMLKNDKKFIDLLNS